MTQELIKKTINIKYFQSKLLDWYHKNKRSMPWRENPTPYHVWISEIMLQQTRVEAVRIYYLRFLGRLPDIKSLAEVSDDELYKLWEGLGYYNRAKNLKKTAELLMRDYNGALPSSYEQLLQLPGIGCYTAGAFASIAFNQNVPAVDGNVMRVISRITGDFRDIMKQSTRKGMEELVKTLILPAEVQHFNQALMELGAVVCIPNGSPGCDCCPVSSICYAYENGKQEELPVKKAKKDRKIEKRTVLVFMNEKAEFFIQKREAKGLLSGLWEFVSIEGELSLEHLKLFLEQHRIYFYKITKIEDSKHIFSHIEWHMKGYLVRIKERQAFDRNQVSELFGTYNGSSEEERLAVKEEKTSLEASFVFRKEQAWCKLDILKQEYSVPTAFKTYLDSIEKGRIKEEFLNK